MVALLDIAPGVSRVHASRRVFEALAAAQCDIPVIHHARFAPNISRDALVLTAGTEIGAMLVDGLGDGAVLECETEVCGGWWMLLLLLLLGIRCCWALRVVGHDVKV